jgi:hypothetical protein
MLFFFADAMMGGGLVLMQYDLSLFSMTKCATHARNHACTPARTRPPARAHAHAHAQHSSQMWQGSNGEHQPQAQWFNKSRHCVLLTILDTGAMGDSLC